MTQSRLRHSPPDIMTEEEESITVNIRFCHVKVGADQRYEQRVEDIV